MQKIYLLCVFVLLLVSCENKELCPTCKNADDQVVRLVINWRTDQSKPAEGMRANLFSLNAMPSYGIEPIGSDGGMLALPPLSKVKTFVYSYDGNNVYLRNENNMDLIEAYTLSTTRASYAKAFPSENTFAEPSGDFYVGINPSFDVVPSDVPLVINVWVENLVKTYTFEVRNVKGAAFITATRGAITGMANSVFLATSTLSSDLGTLLFNANANKTTNKIEGSFRTFGHQPEVLNDFTIEILYPSATGGVILQRTWDVSDQVNTPNNYHIIIDATDIDIPDPGPGGGGGGGDSGFTVDVGDWETETIILN